MIKGGSSSPISILCSRLIRLVGSGIRSSPFGTELLRLKATLVSSLSFLTVTPSDELRAFLSRISRCGTDSKAVKLSSLSVNGGLSLHSKYCSLLSDSVHSEVVSLHDSMLSAESFFVSGTRTIYKIH